MMNYEMKSASVSSTAYTVPSVNSDLKESTIKVKISPKKRSTKKESGLEVPSINTNPQTTNDIKNMISEESEIQKQIEYIHSNITNDETKLLEHLGTYTEEPYHIIESYFEGQHLDRLVRHQIESYNHFVNYQILRTIQMFNPVTIHSENDYIAEKDKYFLEIFISFTNFKLYPPQIHENNGATKMMLPQEAKLRNFTYASTMTVDVNIQYVVRNTENMDTPKIIEKVLPKINIGKLPIMLKSSVCTLTQNKFINHQYTGECSMDCGGYFIIKGSEKTVLGQERAAENRVYCFDGKNTTKWNWFAEIKSVPDFKCISPKQIEMMIASKNNGFGHGIYVNIPRIKQPIELFVLFRALGVLSDKEISQYILLDISDKKQVDLLQCLQASMIDANKYMTQEDALRHITASVAFTPINMDKDTGARKKREFTIEVLDNDLFPHCQTVPQKLYLVGYMAKKLLQTSLGWLPPDDRDSYLNKRIELTGTLLNNLFRNYFNKLVKEMQKQIVREINTGSWRSTEDYENIINMTNIYKIMKSTTIENGINRALSTGDFSIKQSNSSKVGVAQVLNRLTYVSSLSHLRRINTPLEKSGELIAPRKLHNTTWGFLCPAETPEGQSIGVVKNISYMGHITIPTNSSSLYEYVKPYLLSVNDTHPNDMHGKVKVFVNGAWLGVTETPMELYSDMKDKKYRGIINIYISIVFDYKSLEIRICNDGGRLTRPVLKVRDNKALISADIINKLVSKEISWNDLLTNCKLDESVIEYIDPEEQNYAMIAMKCKHGYLQDLTQKFNYTHCEIHPSTVFGVLASCIPYPEHNQAPRNTYQCLSPNELVWMADGSKKCIEDVSIGEKVLSFNPETLEITETTVVNQFVRKNEFPIYKLKTVSGREIIATEDHKLMTNKGWKTIGEMKENINEYKIGILNDKEDIIHFKTTEYSLIKNTDLYQRRFETAPLLGAIVQTVTGNLVEVSSAERIEIFNGVNIDNWMNTIIEEKNNCIFIPIESITPEPDGLVSDIEVESDNHSFIAGSSFLSSNCAMGKQAMGVYATNYDQRMDKTAYVLNYPSRPLVDTRLMNFIHLNRIPSGTQIHVAIMSHTGYNQEDSVLINKGSIDRGLFLATIYHTEKDEDKNIIRDEIIRCKPDPTKTKGIKFGNYDKLNPHGFIPENELVENRDVIIAKTIPIKENRNDPTKTIKYEDQSKTFRTTEETYIDKNYTGRNGDGYNFAKVRVRVLRKPVFGDKFCSLPTQQILTDHGWMDIQYVDITKHKVCSIGTDGNMCYEYPTAKFEYDHNDKMYSIKNKQIEIVCTLNHKLYVQKRYGKNYELIKAEDVMGKMVRFQKSLENAYPDIPTIRIGDVNYDMDAWLQFVGMFISDGHCDKNCKGIYISALKDRKVDFNKQILDNLEIGYSYQEQGKFFISGVKYLNIFEEINKSNQGALNKKLPDYVWNLSKRQSIVLLEALLQGDGSTMKYKDEDEFSRYGTISIQLANDISRLAVHCGWSGIIKIAEEPTGIARIGKRNLGSRAGTEVCVTQKHTYYKVSIIRKQNQPWINKKKNESNKEELIDYNGKVYCIEMPSSHTYYMRESQHSPSLIIGNSSRHGQKGTVGNIIPECDMPFTKEGLRPDIIINPHAIPSRMTIGQLKETLLGKVLLELGLFGDGTSFGNLDIKTITTELQKLGYESYGNELLYNGLTGEQLETNIFIGPVFYQRLKHMVNDKQHSRSIGPMVNLTRQPAEGRSRDGGFRIGEMERDVMLAHGMSRFCRERLYDVSDKYSVHVCKKCGMVAPFNDGNKNRMYANADFTIHLCKTCNNKTEFAKVEIPYAYKLMAQELQTINVVPRIITE